MNECDEDINSWIDRQHHAVIRVKTESLCVRMYYRAKYIMTNCSNRKLEARGKIVEKESIWSLLATRTTTYTIICCVLCPEMKMLKYPCQGTHTTLCYVCECNTVCTMSMKKELCHFSSSQMTIFSREMKIFVNERNHRKMRRNFAKRAIYVVRTTHE